MSDQPVNLSSSGPPETVLDTEPPGAAALADAEVAEEPVAAIGSVCARWPHFCAWACLAIRSTTQPSSTRPIGPATTVA